MYRIRPLSSFITLLLIYSLVISLSVRGSVVSPSPSQVLSRPSGLEVPSDETVEIEPLMGPFAFPQQGLDAATMNFLKGLSGTRFEVAMSVIQTVNKAGGKVVFVGSWISGKNFVDPILGGASDFDMRIVFEGGEELAKAKYNQLRREIVNQITQRFGADAGRILKSTNVYPPEVLLEGIDDAKEAIEKLMRDGINPNLGDAITEGLWGKGAKAFRDAYEAKAGRVVWKEGNLIRSGFADLLPSFGEAAGVYTIQGSGNTSLQFIEKIEDALAKGDAKSAAKSLERLRNTLKKGRDLGRFGPADYLDDILKECCQVLKEVNGRQVLVTDFEKAALELNKREVREGLAASLRRAKIEAELLLRYASETNPEILKVIREMLQVGSGKWKRVMDALLHYGGKVAEIGGKVRWDIAIKGFFGFLILLQARDYYKKATQGDLEGLVHNILLDATFMVSPTFAIGFVPLILKAIMDDAIAAGYAIVTAQQECQELIAGIYEVKGRESLDVNQRTERSVDQLATMYTEEEKVLEVVAVHARNASVRDGIADPAIEKILNEKCGPDIVDRWRVRRIELIAEAIDVRRQIEKEFNSTELIGTAVPEELWLTPEQEGSIEVKAQLEGNLEGIRQNLAEFEKRMRRLGGRDHLVAVETTLIYRWKPYNLTEEDTWSPAKQIFDPQKATRPFKFTGTNIENLRFEFELVIDVKSIVDDVLSVADELDKTFTRSTPFNIRILRPNGKLDIGVPSVLEPEKTITVTALTDDELRKIKDLRFIWTDLTKGGASVAGGTYSFTLGENESKTVRLEAFAKLNGVDAKIVQVEKLVSVGKKATPTPTPTPTASPTPGEEFDASKVEFGGNVPGIWDGGKNPKGFSFKRQVAKTKAPGECQWEGVVNSEVWGKINDWRGPREEELDRRIADITASNKAWGKTTKVRAISISGFKGKLIESSVAWYYGSWSDAGFRGESISASAIGWLYKGRNSVEVGYNIGGGGCWTNVHRAFLMSQATAAQAEANAIIDSLTLVEKNDFKKVPYTGPKLDGSDMPKVVLVPATLEKLKVGDTVKVSVTVENAKPEDSPFKYDWGGEFVGKDTPAAKTASSATIKPNKPGKFRLSVSVEGNRYFLGSASLEYEVADYKVRLERIGNAAAKVPVGGTADFKATLTSDGKPAAGNFVYRWEPMTEVAFEKEEGDTPQNTAKFARPGKAKVWVTVLSNEGGKLTTIAESNQIEIDVVLPKLTLTLTPQKGVVGSEVKAKVTTDVPELTEIDYRWETSSNGKLINESQDASEITFAPQDTKAVTITVNARVPKTGDDLGKQTASFTADPVAVTVTVLGPEGPKPQVWREGFGLVTLEKEIAVHQFVNLRADVVPPVEGMRFEWSVNEDCHFAGNNISQAIRAYRSQTGMCEANVIVRNKDGLELGRGAGAFSATVSQADIDKGKAMGGTTEKVANAKALISKGQLDDAITLIDSVVKADPKNTEAAGLSSKWKTDRMTIQTQLAKVRTLIDQQRFADASRELTVAKNLHGLYPPVVTIESELNEKASEFDRGVNNAVFEIKAAVDQRDYKKALRLCTEIRTKFKLLASTEQTVRGYEEFARSHEAEKERIRGVMKQGEAKFNAGDYDGALADFDQLRVNFNVYWNADIDPEPRYYENLRNEALKRRDRINMILPQIKIAVENPNFDRRQLEVATAMVNEVLQLQPDNAVAQGYKATIAEKLARGENRTKSENSIKLGDQLASERKWPDAIKAYDEAVKADPANANAYRLRGRAKREAGDLKGSLKDFDKALELDPENYQSWLGRGLTKDRSGDKAGAMADFDHGIGLNPSYPNGYGYRASVKLDSNDNAGAIADYDRAISLDPKNAAYYSNRAYAKARLGEAAGAIADYTKAIELNPNNAIAYNNRGHARESMGDFSGALADYEKALQLNPDYTTAKNNLAKLREKMGDGSQPTGSGSVRSGRFRIVSNKFQEEVVLTVEGNRFTGAIGSEKITNGVISGNTVTFHKTTSGFSMGQDYKGTIQGNKIVGKFTGAPWAIGREYWDWELDLTPIGAAPTPVPTPAPTPRPTPPVDAPVIFTNTNIYGVGNQPTVATQFTIDRPHLIISIFTYHWNNGRGTVRPGTVALRDAYGRTFGPWPTEGSPGQGGVPNANWTAYPNISLPAGTYTVVDSDPTTWAQNSGSRGQGHTIVKGRPTGSAIVTPTPAPTPVRTTAGRYVTAIFENRSSEPTHIFPEGDTFGPGNKIAPGERREVRVLMTSTGRIKFTAGRNGQVIATRYWDGDPDDLSRYPRVTFDGRSLIVVTGLR